MAFQPQKTSFIPKQAIGKTPMSARGISGATALVTFLALVAVVVYGGLFVYRSVLNNQIDDLATSLNRARGAFETSLITQLQTIDEELSVGKALLKQHVVISPLFSLLEANTIQTLRYKSFLLRAGNDGVYSMILHGEAHDYASIALQSDIFSQNKFITDNIFSNLALNTDGFISFDFAAKINRGLLSYEQALSKR